MTRKLIQISHKGFHRTSKTTFETFLRVMRLRRIDIFLLLLLSLYFYEIRKLRVVASTIVAIFLRRSTRHTRISTIESRSIPSTKVSQKRNRSSSRDHRPPVPAELSYKSSSQAYPPCSSYPDKSE